MPPLKNLEPTNLRNISEAINKNYDTITSIFCGLEKQGYIIKYGRKFLGTKTTPWIFRLSKKGLEYINYERTKK